MNRLAGWKGSIGASLRPLLKPIRESELMAELLSRLQRKRIAAAALAYLKARVWLLAALGTTMGLLGLIIVLRPAQGPIAAYTPVDPGVVFDDIVLLSPVPGKAAGRFRPALAGGERVSAVAEADDADAASPDAQRAERVRRSLRKGRHGAAWLTGRIDRVTEPIQTASPAADERTIQ